MKTIFDEIDQSAYLADKGITVLSDPAKNMMDALRSLAGFRCILADPPWEQGMMGKYQKHKRADKLEYPTMTLDEIKAMPIADCALPECHLWLWTTNQFLRDGFDVMDAWGFKYLAPIHWIKPNGIGNYFVHVTQTILFGYREKCQFPYHRYAFNTVKANQPKRHSEKPDECYQLIESISPGPRLELFSRTPREGWTSWGNEVGICQA